MRAFVIPLLATTWLLAAARPLLAQTCAGTLDQQQTVTQGIQSGPGPGYARAQTFVAGTSGPLTRVDLFGERGTQSHPQDTLTVEIRKTVGTVPDDSPGGLLAVARIPVLALPFYLDWTAVDFAPGPLVTGGQLLALVMRTQLGFITLMGSHNNEYPSGELLTRVPTDLLWHRLPDPYHAFDFAFRTYVCQAVPVEPTTWSGIKALMR